MPRKPEPVTSSPSVGPFSKLTLGVMTQGFLPDGTPRRVEETRSFENGEFLLEGAPMRITVRLDKHRAIVFLSGTVEWYDITTL